MAELLKLEMSSKFNRVPLIAYTAVLLLAIVDEWHQPALKGIVGGENQCAIKIGSGIYLLVVTENN